MKTVAIVQARMGSTRLPNKVMKLINDIPMIELLFRRLKLSKKIDQIILATSEDFRNDSIVRHIKNLGYEVFRGSEQDVLSRYYEASKLTQATTVVRITGDCPLIDPDLVDQIITAYQEQKVDYLSNTIPPTYPDGLDTEVFSFETLERASFEAIKPTEREHVTPFIRESGLFKIGNLSYQVDYSRERWTVDEAVDFEVVSKIFNRFYPRIDFNWLEVIDLKAEQAQLFQANQHIKSGEGITLGTGQKLWKRAKHIIPGGNMLLSKRAEMFLPNQWPAYFSKAKGCKVWDLEGREYIDMSIMGIGTNTLGYGHPAVDEAVLKTIEAGNMSTFNCPEEVYLAERLVELHPWGDMVRLTRSGGEANAVAIRIARAASGRDQVAICGYHGWHDWYLAANLGDNETLAGHLLPGLAPNGVPANLKGTVFSFNYNDFSELKKLVNTQNIGVIKMEVVRNQEPQDDFLLKVRDLATNHNIVLIFDECTSGFRQNLGGLHKTYGVEPDMAMFGKALGNGYAIAAVVGKRAVMEAAQTSFISSTFWTERIGPSAALKTLEVMASIQSWEQITQTGREIMTGWKKLAKKYDLSINISGLPALASFTFNSSKALEYKTLITQEMLKKGYLAGNSIYACTEHSPEIIKHFFEELDPIFGMIKECEEDHDIMTLLKGPVCYAGFKRLN